MFTRGFEGRKHGSNDIETRFKHGYMYNLRKTADFIQKIEINLKN